MRRSLSLVLVSICLAACNGSKPSGHDMAAAHHDMSEVVSATDMTISDMAVGPDLTPPPDLWIPGTCSDGQQNQNETDVDCGGICGRTCKPLQKCAVDGDCIDRSCGQNGTCAQICPTVNNPAPAALCPGGSALSFSGNNFLPGAFIYINGTTALAARIDVLSSMAARGLWGTVASGGPFDARITDPARTCFAQLTTTFTVESTGPTSLVSDTPLVWNGITTPLQVSAGTVTAPITDVSYGHAPAMTTSLTIASKTANSAIVSLANGITPGSYDLVLSDSNTMCSRAFDPNALTIIGGSPTVTLTIAPTSGANTGAVQLDITATNAMFSPDVQVYLAPHGSPATAATRATGFHLVDGGHVQASVPAAIAKTTYDVITVGAANGGTVGQSSVVYTAN